MAGKCRTVRPYFLRQITVETEGNLFFCQIILQFLADFCSYHPAVKAKALPVLHVLLQIFIDGRYTLIHHTVQRNTGAFHLTFCLDEIPAVCPHTGPVSADYQRSVGTCEITEVLSYLEKICCIL